MTSLYGKDWRTPVITQAKGHISQFIRNNNLEQGFIDYVTINKDEKQIEQTKHYFKHIHEKEAIGKGYYETMTHIGVKDLAPAIIFKNMFTYMHPTEDRLLSMREGLHMMGHPDDFILYGTDPDKCRKIGQNVPVNTARWIVSEAVRIINDWDTIERAHSGNVAFFDNTKQTKNFIIETPEIPFED